MCKHFWVYESPDGETSKGVCKLCGTETTGRNSLPGQTRGDFLRAIKGREARQISSGLGRGRISWRDDENSCFDDVIGILEK